MEGKREVREDKEENRRKLLDRKAEGLKWQIRVIFTLIFKRLKIGG